MSDARWRICKQCAGAGRLGNMNLATSLSAASYLLL